MEKDKILHLYDMIIERNSEHKSNMVSKRYSS